MACKRMLLRHWFVVLGMCVAILITIAFYFTINDSLFKSDVTIMNDVITDYKKAIIIGSPNCGTSALIDFLDYHPQIKTKVEDLDRNNQTVLEINSDHFSNSQLAPLQLKETSPDAKLLLIVREPVERLMSEFLQLKVEGAIKPKRKFEDWILEFDDQSSIITEGRYSEHYEKWTREFDPKQIHIIDGGQFREDPFSQMVQIEKFLELDPFFKSDHFELNEKSQFFCFVDNNQVNCPVGGRKHPKMVGFVQKGLRKYFSEFNVEFFKQIGKEFDWPEA